MIIVSNTSPLIAFSRIDRLDVLQGFAPRIVIPGAVAQELRAGSRIGEPVLEALEAGDWIKVREVKVSPLLRLLEIEVDRGEAEAIALALELRGVLLIDDRAGRAAARRLDLIHVGTFGVLGEAKRSLRIASVAPLVAALIAAGIFFHPKLVAAFLEAHGESL